MKFDVAKLARSGAIAVGALCGLTLPSMAGPAGMAQTTEFGTSARSALTPLLVQSTEPDYRNGNDGREWGNGWDDEWRRRRSWRRHGPDTNWVPRHRHPRSGIYFNFDLTPRYVEPRYVYPRRTYRGLSQAHVNWCYNRYRSYRAWDNSFQPYGGPRQQCWSPYS